VIVIIQTTASFFAVNLIFLVSSAIHLPASDTAIVKSYIHSCGISNVYVSFSFNNEVPFKLTTFFKVLLDGEIDFICN
jgi:hypothetical protein